MIIRFRGSKWLQCSAAALGLAMAAFAAPSYGDITTLIDDDFGDGQGGNTGTVTEVAEANFFTTSSGDGISTDPALAVAGGGFRFISGTSGRAIHTQFSPTTLATAGDRIDVSFEFTTPDTVQTSPTNTSDEEFRFGLFDTSNASGVNVFSGRNITAGAAGTEDTGNLIDFNGNISTGSSNNQPGLELAGFTAEIDIERDNADADISFRVSDLTGDSTLFATEVAAGNGETAPGNAGVGISGNRAPSGRLTTTTAGFDGLGSGDGFGFNDLNGDGTAQIGEIFTVDPNTTYLGTLSIELLSSGDFAVTSSVDGGNLDGTLNLASDTILATGAGTEAGLDTSTFDLLTFSVSGSAFGVGSVADSDGDGALDLDNGITFNNLTVTSTITAVPEPSSLALIGLMCCAGLVRRRR